MHQEIAVASRWWANQIRASPLAAQSAFLADHFEQSLVEILHAHYAGHWYRHDVLRGSAYRAITYDHRLDSSLRRAGESAGIVWNRLEKLLQQARFVVMFVNPGEVKLSRLSSSAASNHASGGGAYGGGGAVELLYSAPTEETDALQDALLPLSPMLYACTNGLTVTQVILGSNRSVNKAAVGVVANNHHTDASSSSSSLSPAMDAPFAPSTSPPMSSSANLSPSAPLSPYSPSLTDDRDPYRMHRAVSAVGVGAGSSAPTASMLAMS